MSESLKSWLFTHCSTQAASASELNYDLHDMPYLPGNRIQLLRFLTFRPASSPNSLNTDVWALVGDRTHCIAARFARDQVHRFHLDHPLTFTSLKGALLTLTNLRVGVARVQNDTAGGPYRQGQYAMVLDVKGWKVVSSVCERVWFAGVKVVTSANGVPEGEREGYGVMIGWMKRWIRYKNLVRRAGEVRKVQVGQRVDEGGARGGVGVGVKLPTPAQRRTIVLSSSQVQPPIETRVQDESLPLTTLSPTGCTQLVSPAHRDGDTAALWTDFDLDAQIDLDNIDVSNQWLPAITSPSSAARPAPPPGTQPKVSPPSPAQASPSPSHSQTQTQTQSDLDPYESGLSDYERESRLQRKRAKQSPETATAQALTTSALPGSQRASTPDETVREEVVEMRVVDQERHSSSSAKTQPAEREKAAPESIVPPSSSSTSASTTITHKQQRKRHRRQAALAALMAQIVD